MPSDRTVLSICREFKVDETWLRTGAGTMLRNVSREEEVAALFADPTSDFAKQMIPLLAVMNDQQLDLLADYIFKLAELEKKKCQPPDSD